MTHKEAMELESYCDELISSAIGIDTTVSYSISGYFKIGLDGDGWICVNQDGGIGYLKFSGFKSDFDEYCNKITETIKQNHDTFEQLKWSYEHINELED